MPKRFCLSKRINCEKDYCQHLYNESNLCFNTKIWYPNALARIKLIAFDRTHTIYVVFQSRGFYDVPRVLIAGARSFQAFAAI